MQSKMLRAMLPKMGFNRNFPRAVVHGPFSLGGNQLIDVKVEQFVLQLVDMMTVIRKMDIIGEQLISAFDSITPETPWDIFSVLCTTSFRL